MINLRTECARKGTVMDFSLVIHYKPREFSNKHIPHQYTRTSTTQPHHTRNIQHTTIHYTNHRATHTHNTHTHHAAHTHTHMGDITIATEVPQKTNGVTALTATRVLLTKSANYWYSLQACVSCLRLNVSMHAALQRIVHTPTNGGDIL